MKKIVFMMLAFVATAFAADAKTAAVAVKSLSVASETFASYSVIAAAICLGIAACGGAIGMGNTAAATITGTARNPGIGGKLMTTMFVALAMIEAQVIYALVIALIIFYANPFIAA